MRIELYTTVSSKRAMFSVVGDNIENQRCRSGSIHQSDPLDLLHLVGSGSTFIPAPDPHPLPFPFQDPDPLKRALIWIRLAPKVLVQNKP